MKQNKYCNDKCVAICGTGYCRYDNPMCRRAWIVPSKHLGLGVMASESSPLSYIDSQAQHDTIKT